VFFFIRQSLIFISVIWTRS